MKALILAAGRGERMRPLTDACPKPLLPAGGGRRLFDWQLAALREAGVAGVVLNTAHLADAFEAVPGELARWGFDAAISREGSEASEALESLGGIAKALPLLTDGVEPFLVLAGDVVHHYPLSRLLAWRDRIVQGDLDGVVVAVPNPGFHAKGDLTVREDGTLVPGAGPHTYACLMIVSPRVFEGVEPVRAKLFPWLWTKAEGGRILGEVWTGWWDNVGNPAQLEALAADESARAPVDAALPL